MKQKEIMFANLIADLVVEKLHNDFAFKLMDESFKEEEEEKLIGELARLTTLLIMYEEKELYEKAAIIKNKIRIINKKLNND